MFRKSNYYVNLHEDKTCEFNNTAKAVTWDKVCLEESSEVFSFSSTDFDTVWRVDSHSINGV